MGSNNTHGHKVMGQDTKRAVAEGNVPSTGLCLNAELTR